MNPFRFLVGMLAVAASFSAMAHDTLGRDWCADPHAVPVILETFEFQKQDLIELSSWVVPAADLDKCGMVDRSQWHSAMHVSTNFCAEVSQGDENVRAIVLEPHAYLASRHHNDYTFAEGLKGVCVYCPAPPKPTTPKP
jgi:hypothetical protein